MRARAIRPLVIRVSITGTCMAIVGGLDCARKSAWIGVPGTALWKFQVVSAVALVLAFVIWFVPIPLRPTGGAGRTPGDD